LLSLCGSIFVLFQIPVLNYEKLALLGVGRGSQGTKGPAPKGLKNLAQGLPWVLV